MEMYKQKTQRHLLLCTLLFLSLGLNAQVKFIATAPETVTKGEQFKLAYKLQGGEGKDISFPSSIKGFDILYGPALSLSSITQVINGNITTDSSVSYIYTLIAKSEGLFTLPIVTIMVDGKRVTTLNSVHIKVLSPVKLSSPPKDK